MHAHHNTLELCAVRLIPKHSHSGARNKTARLSNEQINILRKFHLAKKKKESSLNGTLIISLFCCLGMWSGETVGLVSKIHVTKVRKSH